MTNDNDDRALASALRSIGDDVDAAELAPRLQSRITSHRRRRAVAASLGVAAVVALAVIVPITVLRSHDARQDLAGPAASATTSVVGTFRSVARTSSALATEAEDTKGRAIITTGLLPTCRDPQSVLPATDPNLTLSMNPSADGPVWTVAGTNTTASPITLSIGRGNVIITDGQGRLVAFYTKFVLKMDKKRRIEPGATWLETFPNPMQPMGVCADAVVTTSESIPRLKPGAYQAVGIAHINGADVATSPIPLTVDTTGRIAHG